MRSPRDRTRRSRAEIRSPRSSAAPRARSRSTPASSSVTRATGTPPGPLAASSSRTSSPVSSCAARARPGPAGHDPARRRRWHCGAGERFQVQALSSSCRSLKRPGSLASLAPRPRGSRIQGLPSGGGPSGRDRAGGPRR
eukprot:2963610-Rhodomonas_salina.1